VQQLHQPRTLNAVVEGEGLHHTINLRFAPAAELPCERRGRCTAISQTSGFSKNSEVYHFVRVVQADASGQMGYHIFSQLLYHCGIVTQDLDTDVTGLQHHQIIGRCSHAGAHGGLIPQACNWLRIYQCG